MKAQDRLVIKGGRIIDPLNEEDSIRDIFIHGDKIASGEEFDATHAKVIDASGLVVTPGFIDIHTHLREPGFEDKESISSGTSAAAAGGFTTICAMPNTNPAIDSAHVVDYITLQASKAGPIRVFCFGAVSKGRNGVELTDMEELASAGVVGFTDDGSPVQSGHLMEMALRYASDLKLPVMDHCEDYSMTKGLGIHEGKVSYRLGLQGYPSAAEESIIARDIAIAEHTGAHLHIAHISTSGGVDLVRSAKSRGVHVTAEVTPHHLTMTEDWILGEKDDYSNLEIITANAYDTRAKVSPPLRTHHDREKLIEGLKDGTIDAIATDHAPHTFGDKAVPFDQASVGISVLETAFGSLMTLVHANIIKLPDLVHRLTVGPASVLGAKYNGLSHLGTGSFADIVLIDTEEKWTVNTNKFNSKGKNTPLESSELRGKVKLTIANGQIAYEDMPND